MIQIIRGNKSKLYKTLNIIASATNILVGITLLLKTFAYMFETTTAGSYSASLFADTYTSYVNPLSATVLATCVIIQFTTIYKLRKLSISCSNQEKITLTSLILLLAPYFVGIAVFLGF